MNRPQDDPLDFLNEITPQRPQPPGHSAGAVPVPPPPPHQTAPLDFLSGYSPGARTPATNNRRDSKASANRVFAVTLIAGLAATAAIALAAIMIYHSNYDH